MKLLEVREEINIRLKYLPDWIDNKSPKHKKVWNLIESCHDALFLLIVNVILTDKSIYKIIDLFDEYIENMCLLMDNELQILTNLYFLSVLEYMILICLENEEYEAANNLKIFKNIYFENINSKNEY